MATRISEIKKIYIETKAVCNPFYIRFYNQFGGIDYFMFEKSQASEYKTEQSTLIEKSVTYLDTDTANLKKTNVEMSNSVRVGKANVDASTFLSLQKHLLPALKIQKYNESETDITKKWTDIYIENSTLVFDNDKREGVVELTFTTNKIYTLTA